MARTRPSRARSARIRLLGGLAAVAVAGLAAVGPAGPAASQDAGIDLASADAFASGSPVATVLRIPNEIPGGALFTQASTSLDKTQAKAAGFTPGELAEAFLQTTVVAPDGVPPELTEGVLPYSNPALFVAQTPPSEVFPSSSSLADGGVSQDGVKALSLRADTDETSASADAVGGFAVEQDGISIANGGSESSSYVADDGTVVADTRAYLSDVSIANGLLRIGGITSSAHVELKPGSEPVQELSVAITGASLAGIPVLIDQDGIRVADTPLLGLGELGTLNQALASLESEGFSIQLFPGIEKTADDRSVRVAGSALSIRGSLVDYVPTAVDTPLGPVGSPLGDVGTDNELLLGRVEASVFAAERGPLPDPPAFPTTPLPTPSATPAPTPVAAPTTPVPSTGTPLPAEATPSADTSVDDTPEVAAPVADTPFELVRRSAPPGVDQLRTGYRWVMGICLLTTIVLLGIRRTRLA